MQESDANAAAGAARAASTAESASVAQSDKAISAQSTQSSEPKVLRDDAFGDVNSASPMELLKGLPVPVQAALGLLVAANLAFFLFQFIVSIEPRLFV